MVIQMYGLTLLVFLLISASSFGKELPNEIFNIKLFTNINSINEKVIKGRGITIIQGVSYNIYSVVNDLSGAKGKFDRIILRVKESDGTIAGIVGESILSDSSCLQAIESYRKEIEKKYEIQFTKNKGAPQYSLIEGGKAMLLACETKSETVVQFGLTILE